MAKDPLDRERWERAALAAIERGGPAAVAVVPLARELGVTKGSFYWHYDNRAELLAAALRRWEHEQTEELLAGIGAIENPHERLAELFRYSLEAMAPTIYARLLAAAPDEPVVAAVVERTTEARIAFLERAFADLGMTPARAKRQALLTYAMYTGMAALTPTSALPGDARGRAALSKVALEVLVPR